MRDITLGSTSYFYFTTRSFSTGAPTTLAGTPVISAYEDNSITQITAGVTLGVDHDSVTGLNLVTVVATSGNGFESGKEYALVITTGTVGGVSVVGEVVGEFSIENNAAYGIVSDGTFGNAQLVRSTTPANTLDVSATGEVGLDFGNVTGTLTNTNLAFVDSNERVDVGRWLGTAVTTSATSSKPEIDLYSISDDATSANNLELQFDGTGLIGDEFPARQDQLDRLVIGSASISTVAESYTLTTGVQSSGTFADTETRDTVEHIHTDTAGSMDLYYQFDVGGTGVATEAVIFGRVNGAGDDLTIYAWDWLGSTWDALGVYAGQGSTTNIERSYSYLNRHTGTGADLGKVRVRFQGTGLTTATLSIDQIFTSYAVVSLSVGYDDGYVYLDATIGTTGTEIGVSGTITGPLSSISDARTVADALSLRKFDVKGGPFTLDQSYTNWVFRGENPSLLTLNSQDVSGTTFRSMGITGTTTNTTQCTFNLCGIIGAVTVGPAAFINCSFSGTTTLSARTTYVVDRSTAFSSTTPIFDVNGDGVTPTILLLQGFNGVVELQNMTSVDVVVVTGNARVTLNANCTGGTLTRAGDIKITDNSGNVTINDGNIDDILTDTGTTIPAQIAALNNLSAAEVNAEVLDVIQADTFAELASVPAATSSLKDKLTWVFMLARNQLEQTATTATVRADDTTTAVATATVSDDGTTATRGEFS